MVTRVMPSVRAHVYSGDIPLHRDAVGRVGHELWVLHPAGEDVGAVERGDAVQVLLLDGSWREASRMRRVVEGWGRLVRLPNAGRSRYRLRNQHASGMLSTAEALIELLEVLGETEPAEALRVQFELHVYAGLRSRGAVVEAEEFLSGSRLMSVMPEVMAELMRRRVGPAVGNCLSGGGGSEKGTPDSRA